ncbi:MAG: ACT domain-containing protein, partial [Candidatus Limnocylindrales bacterium]
MIWFTVQLEDRPGALARVAAALAERRVNIT